MKKRKIHYLIFMVCCITIAANLNCYVKKRIQELDEIFIKQEHGSKELQKERLNDSSVFYNISTITVLRKIRAVFYKQIQFKKIFVCKKEINFIVYRSELYTELVEI